MTEKRAAYYVLADSLSQTSEAIEGCEREAASAKKRMDDANQRADRWRAIKTDVEKAMAEL